jgi:threonine dehydratase
VTPTRNYPGLDRMAGCELWVKHENHQPVGAFKVRGGVNLVACLNDSERAAGITGASSGNHGSSIAFAGNRFGVHTTVFVPEGANEVKVARIRDLGAAVVFAGRDFDDAREACEEYSSRHGSRYIHSGNEPLLIAGVGTGALELLEGAPPLDALVVPIGGGSGAAGAILATSGVSPATEAIGVQSESAPTAYEAWRSGEPRAGQSTTFAEGLATRSSFDLLQQMLRGGLADFFLVSDDEIRAAMLAFIDHTQNLCEAAGAAALAGVLSQPKRFAGKRVGTIASGGNITLSQLRELLAGIG